MVRLRQENFCKFKGSQGYTAHLNTKPGTGFVCISEAPWVIHIDSWSWDIPVRPSRYLVAILKVEYHIKIQKNMSVKEPLTNYGVIGEWPFVLVRFYYSLWPYEATFILATTPFLLDLIDSRGSAYVKSFYVQGTSRCPLIKRVTTQVWRFYPLLICARAFYRSRTNRIYVIIRGLLN